MTIMEHTTLRVTLSYSLKNGFSFISLLESDPIPQEWEEWEGKFSSLPDAIKEARDAGIPVTHRAVIPVNDKDPVFVFAL